MKHQQRDIQCPASQGTVYPFDVSYSALLVTKLTETSVASVYLYLIYSAIGAFDLSMQSAISVYISIISGAIYTRGQPHPKYKANSARTSHIAVWERDPIVRGDWGRVARWPAPLREVQLTGMAPEVRNKNTVLVQFET